jgi:REP element-mobilizing transposase RayT
MHTISRDNPCYYLTSVAKDRLPVFRTDAIKAIICNALDEARKSGGFAVYAYVVMPDHLHIITDSVRQTDETLRYLNGIASRRVIGYLKEKGYDSSLAKLRRESVGAHQHTYSLWEKHPNKRLLWDESMLMERVNYTHQNPVRARLVERAQDYPWSSARCWRGIMLPDEPLLVDLDKINWRKK